MVETFQPVFRMVGDGRVLPLPLSPPQEAVTAAIAAAQRVAARQWRYGLLPPAPPARYSSAFCLRAVGSAYPLPFLPVGAGSTPDSSAASGEFALG